MPDLARRLRAQARALGVSAASLCHLAWAQVLARTTGREDVVFGTVLFGRMQGGAGADRVLGMFINTLPVRLEIGDEGVADGVRRSHAQLADLVRHEHAPLALAQRCSAVPAPAPLFTTLLNYRHSPGLGDAAEAAHAWDGIELITGEERTNYPLVLSVDDLGTGFRLTAQAQPPIEPERLCGYMHTALANLVAALEQAPDTAVRAIDVLSESERRMLLEDWNATAEDFRQDRCLHELFEEQAEQHPEAPALVFEDRQLSYAELNARANRLAHYLRSLGVKPDDRVAICLARSFEHDHQPAGRPQGGGAYVPLDPAYPEERLAFMLEDSAPLALLTDSGLKARLTERSGGTVLRAFCGCGDSGRIEPGADSRSGRSGVTPEHLAYVIYTSGSTGQPKGVMVAARAAWSTWSAGTDRSSQVERR